MSDFLPSHYKTPKKPKLKPMIEVVQCRADWLSDNVPTDEWRKNREQQIREQSK